MILTAKNNKYKVEIEIERKNSSKKYFHQWMVLRINKINIKEDKGVWSCQIFVNDERNGGRVKLEAESRKQITDNTIRPTQTKSREFLRRGRRTHQNDLSEEAWYLKQSEEEGPNNGERTFGFSKSDGNYAIFERSSIGAKPLESSLLPNYYDKIEYIRNIKESSELLGNKENAWRRRSKTAKNGGVQPVQLGLKLSVKIILLIIMLNILFF
uniref:Uncharacterized protein n=1 Tax=Meloidogyne hapla TaxID=6305 RepID=A0A1I8B0M7_MELHA